MKKQLIVMALMAALCLSTACGSSGAQPAASGAQKEEPAAAAETAAEPAAEAEAAEPAAEAAEPAAEAPAAEAPAAEAAEPAAEAAEPAAEAPAAEAAEPAAEAPAAEAPAAEAAEPAAEAPAAEAAEPAAEAPAAEAAEPAAEAEAETPVAQEELIKEDEHEEAPVPSIEAKGVVNVVEAKTVAIGEEAEQAMDIPEIPGSFKISNWSKEEEAAAEAEEAAAEEGEVETDASSKVPEEDYKPLEKGTITVWASSALSGYPLDNLFDGNEKTAWIEGVSGDGLGEYIEFFVPAGTYMDHFYIITGYHKSEDLYWKNGAPTELCVVAGGQYQYIYLYDEYGIYQSAFFDPIYSDGSIRIYITGVRPGYKYSDTCISELWF